MSAKFEKIIIVGSSCAGKTTLANRLAKIINGKAIDIDDYHWLPNWKSTPTDQLIKKLEKAMWGHDRWTISGNYSNTMPFTMPQADTVIWLDFPLPLILWRIFTRTTKRIITKQEVCNGNRETFWNAFFAKDNLFMYTLQNYKKKKINTVKLPEQYPNITMIQIKNPRELKAFMAENFPQT